MKTILPTICNKYPHIKIDTENWDNCVYVKDDKKQKLLELAIENPNKIYVTCEWAEGTHYHVTSAESVFCEAKDFLKNISPTMDSVPTGYWKHKVLRCVFSPEKNIVKTSCIRVDLTKDFSDDIKECRCLEQKFEF